MNVIIDDFCKDFCFEKGITNKQCEVINPAQAVNDELLEGHKQ